MDMTSVINVGDNMTGTISDNMVDVKMDVNTNIVETPYRFTVIYDSSDPLSIALSVVCSRAQVIDLREYDTNLAYICEHPTPEVFLIGLGKGADVPQHELEQFIARGATTVNVFSNTEYSHDKIVTFNFDNIFKHIPLSCGMVGLYLVEYMATLRGINSIVRPKEITKARAEQLWAYVKFIGGDPRLTFHNICDSMFGFDMIEIMIGKGQMMLEFMNFTVENIIKGGIEVEISGDKVLVVMTNEEAIIEKFFEKNIEYKYIMLANLIRTDEIVWSVIIGSNGGDAGQKMWSCVGDDVKINKLTAEYAHCFVSPKDAKKLLPHIYLF